MVEKHLIALVAIPGDKVDALRELLGQPVGMAMPSHGRDNRLLYLGPPDQLERALVAIAPRDETLS